MIRTLAFLLAVCLSGFSSATVTYVYEGQAFDDFFGPTNNGQNILGLTNISGYVTFSAPLAAGAFADEPTVIDLEFTDGKTTLNLSNAQLTERFFFETDLAGDIIQWKIVLDTFNTQNFEIRQFRTAFDPDNPGVNHDQSSYCHSSTCGVRLGGDVMPNDLGSWTVIPLPAAIWFFLSAVSGLIGVKRLRN